MNPKDHLSWDNFKEFCEEQGIYTDRIEYDWQPLWRAWIKGYELGEEHAYENNPNNACQFDPNWLD